MIFTVNELKQLISSTESDSLLQMRIELAENFICKYTNNDFADKDGKKNYPPDVKSGAVRLIDWQINNKNGNIVKSETVSRCSVTYDTEFECGYPAGLVSFLKPYKRSRF